MIEAGQKAPNFSIKNANENDVSLSDFKGKWVILYFYPKDNTPGCTIEALDFMINSNLAFLNAFAISIANKVEG